MLQYLPLLAVFIRGCTDVRGCLDGVAPRAKMNQQRSRRFRSAQEAKEKDEDKAEFLKMLESQQSKKSHDNGALDGEKTVAVIEKTWDSNAITPGTPFMDTLAASLRYWTAYKLNTDHAWAKVIRSCLRYVWKCEKLIDYR
jgi:5'-3' exoribonuclease 2